MFERNYFSLRPGRGTTFRAQLEDCLDQLEAPATKDDPAPGRGSGLRGSRKNGAGRILKLTLFVDSSRPADFAQKKRSASRILKDRFGPALPPFSVIAQAPEKGLRVAVDAETLPPATRSVRVRYARIDGLPYCVVAEGRNREVIVAGLTAGSAGRTIEARSDAAFALARRILERERLQIGDIVRQWNFIEDLLRVRTVGKTARQNYQDFNDARQRFYGRASFPSGYPAATGIGAAAGGVVVEFLAAARGRGLSIVPLSNPLQKDAHRYSQNVLIGGSNPTAGAKAAPLFERGKFVGRGANGVLYVSGTAAVRRQATAAAGDAAAQTRITIANIRRLVSAENLARQGIDLRGRRLRLASYRAYVKRRRDLPAVQSICRRAFGPVPSQFVRADVCREELLVEIEGVFVLRPGTSLGRR